MGLGATNSVEIGQYSPSGIENLTIENIDPKESKVNLPVNFANEEEPNGIAGVEQGEGLVMYCMTPETKVQEVQPDFEFLLIRRRLTNGSKTFWGSENGYLLAFSGTEKIQPFIKTYREQSGGRYPKGIRANGSRAKISLRNCSLAELQLLMGPGSGWNYLCVDPRYVERTTVGNNGDTKTIHKIAIKKVIPLNLHYLSDPSRTKNPSLPLPKNEIPVSPTNSDNNNGDGSEEQGAESPSQPTSGFPVFGNDARVLARTEQTGASPITFG
ncbi:MAG: hypothetical protein V1690_02480 [Candidatus Moraniibacteriota bacterium]